MKALIHASELLTGKGFSKKRGKRPKEEDIERIVDGAVVYGEEIEWVGPTQDLPPQFRNLEIIDLQGEQAVTAGWIDCHTHMIFDGDRSEEFALRCGGVSYSEIAKKGGGILTTMKATRDASLERLVELGEKRIREAVRLGVRGFEIKSGYGLDTGSELKSLEAIQILKTKFPNLPIQSTFLGAHAFPPDFSRDAYLKEILDNMLLLVAKQKLADACDVFIDEGYYSLDEGRKILEKAKSLGLKIKLHGDELKNTESAVLAAELGALSVDHLLKVSKKGIDALSQSETVAVLLPGTAFYLKEAYAPARALLDAGACVALSTDFNPGSSMINHLPAILTLGALYQGMTRAELLCSVTYNAAKALGWQNQMGTLEVGKKPLFTILPFSRFEEAYYRFAWTA